MLLSYLLQIFIASLIFLLNFEIIVPFVEFVESKTLKPNVYTIHDKYLALEMRI